MPKPKMYKVIREYDNQYGLEELVRRIIRRHLEEFCEDNTGLKFPKRAADDCNERLTG